jgi:uncharacterized membrane protein
MEPVDRHPLHGLHWTARLTAFQGHGLAIFVGTVAAYAAARLAHTASEVPWLAGWLAYNLTYLAIAWQLIVRLNAHSTRRRAQRTDPGSVALFALVAAAACASIVAVVLAVDTGRSMHGVARWGYLAVAMMSLAASWLLLQTAFALHYARVFYQRGQDGAETEGGLIFPGGHDPDYLDFVYFSAIVGMTSQVSDVAVSGRRMRRLTLLHGLLSFAFNLIVLALAVNVFAGSLA